MQLFVSKVRRVVGAALALLVLTVPAWADTALERATLKGITAVTVVVEGLDTETERAGVTTAQLRTDVELQLRQAGILVRPASEGTLYVNASLVRAKRHPLYAFKIQLQYRQAVVLSRAHEIPSVATTWETGGTGILDASRLREVRTFVGDLVAQFVNAYLEQNPKP
jgi:hypothetical protein